MNSDPPPHPTPCACCSSIFFTCLVFISLLLSPYLSFLPLSISLLHLFLFLHASLTFCSLLCLSGGIATDLQDKRKKCQNKRKNQITDSSQLKDLPCKRFRQVSSSAGRKQHKGSCDYIRCIRPLKK